MRYRETRGQGMMEAVIAIGILITSVVIIISLSIATTDFGRRAESRNFATNLAREGLEIARQKRDSNWLQSATVLTPFHNSLFPTANGTVQVAFASVLFVPPTNTTLVNFDSTLGANNCYTNRTCTCYTSGTTCSIFRDANGVHTSLPLGTATPYRRLIFIQPKDATGADTTVAANTVSLHVISQVYWREKNQPQYVTLETDLYDWKNNNSYDWDTIN